ncbi:hypothetical protein LCGC14_3078830 [marine sediment metagenome]|uniref:IrrE N-terminal-like domain-containing protein n=1 Tax=marine sediment metagenome TaxID=412755 RepID=A0A0F8WDV6_9ZZZZ
MVPRTLDIKGHKFAIRQSKKKDLLSDCVGDCDPDKNLIQVYNRLPPSRKLEVLLHEVLHAMLGSHNITQEEEVCTLLGEYLVQFIRYNPDFIRHALKTLSQ